tara:strand:- start:3569 stop:4192 length:624 start_codon:yes stop_codon:yes gene_type:complete
MPRKPKTIHYIYKTTCNVTNRYYVGMHSTNNLEDGYMGSGRRLRASIRKHGKDKYTKVVLAFYDTRELLVEAEIKAITPEMVDDDNCMNLKGGEGGLHTLENTKEGWRICREMYPEKINEWSTKGGVATFKKYGTKHKFFDNRRDWTGLNHTDESKRKMSESSKGMGSGKTNSQYGTCWVTKSGESKKIKKEDLKAYLEEGWFKGRK